MSNSGTEAQRSPALSTHIAPRPGFSRTYGPQPFEPVRYKNFEIRLAENDAELEAAQALRYRVFYEEMGATPSLEVKLAGRDFDPFDAVCDHLLVFDHAKGGADSVVGTYRLTRRSVALKHFGFYSEQEYDIAPLIAYPGKSSSWAAPALPPTTGPRASCSFCGVGWPNTWRPTGSA